MQKILPCHIIISERQSEVMGTWPQAISSILIRLCIFHLRGAIFIFLVTSFSLPFSELGLVRLALDLVD